MNDSCWNETRSCKDPAQPLTTAVTDQLTWEMLLINQVLIQKNKILVYKQSAGSTVGPALGFLNQDLDFFEQVLGLQVSVETGESAQPLITAITDQLMTQ